MIPTVPNEIDANKINNDIFYNGLSEIKKHINYSLEDLIEYLESEISSYGGDTKYKISKIAYCEDKFGNPYLFVEFNPFGTLLMSLINNETVLINIGDPVKRIEKLNSNEVYIFDHILYEFSKKSKDYEKVENNSLSKNFTRNLVDVKKSISNKNSFNARARTTFKNSDNARFYKKSDSNYTDPENKLVYADKEVKYSWWFKGLKDNFGYSSPKDDWNFNTKNGICHHIAASILLQYSQLFLSNRTLSDRQLKRYMTVLEESVRWRDDVRLATTPTFNKIMAYDMWSEQSNKTFFTNHIQMKRYIDNFIQRDKKDNPLDIYTNIWGSIKPWKWIDEGLPVMLMGHLWTYGYHAVVAYGYWKDKNKYLVHYGWEGQSQVIMSTSFLFETWSIALKPKYDSYLNTRYFLLDNKEISLKSYTKMMANPNEKYPDDYPFKDYYWYW